MNQLDELRNITKKAGLARLLGVKPSTLTNILYRIKPAAQYTNFSIPKKSGGTRTIFAPASKLKALQSKLSILLLDCIDEINADKFPKSESNLPKKHQSSEFKTLKVKISNSATKQQPSLSHGFVRHRSIITNAMMHLNQKNVLNIDLSNFFDSFNFGRVRGFFIKNKNFKLHQDIATVIAQIACYDNKLPQGSPCSPVITNLITHSLDIRLASLAKKHSCTYSRYADDITFSTRKSIFPTQIMRQEESGEYIAGKKLRSNITRAGFSINDKKTRIQYKDSRQDVTGLIVNEKPNVKKEYWRTVKSQCHRLFHTGSFTEKTAGGEVEGNINKLEGQLNFIDQIDRYNRMRQKPPINHEYALSKHGYNTTKLLTGREKTFSEFLYYQSFYANTKPTIICEGKTDNIYIKSAINRLIDNYPELAKFVPKTDPKTKKEYLEYKLLIRFFNYSKRTRFLLELFGGAPYLSYFISKFDNHHKFFNAPKPQHPVIIILDNDSGFSGKKDSGIEGKLKKIESTFIYPDSLKKDDFRSADFIHVMHNLYIVLTPLDASGKETAIEDLFDEATRKEKLSNKIFNPSEKDFDKTKEYGKEIFANKIVKAKKDSINFDGLKPLLDRIVSAINHYDRIKSL